jgi:hypothetical protein
VDSEYNKDEELAVYTDALMGGASLPEQPPGRLAESDDPQDQALAKVIRHLSAIEPTDATPSPQLHTRLQRELADEFDRVRREKTVIRLQQRRFIRLASAAAVLVLVAAGVVLFAGEGGSGTEGTATEGDALLLVGVGVALVVIAGVMWFFRQRR